MKKLNYLFIIIFLMAGTLAAQNYTISGKVTNAENGEELVGANVYIPALNQGGVTDFEGNYSITQVPAGTHLLKISYIGYQTKTETIEVSSNQTLNFEVTPTTVMLEGLVVEVNRAVERETPITYTEISREDLQSKYNTQDVPNLLKAVPGVFTATGGLGESSIYVRGFDFEQVLILINGVPVNDPESQQVYWSNWTGLSSSAASVQVQRGVGASLVGSGALGGSVNITTGLYSRVPRVTVKGSAGLYTTKGIDGGPRDGKSADGVGGFQNYSPSNQNFYVEYVTGQMYDGKVNMKLSYERKAGDSYIDGTYYNGHAFYFGLQSILGKHLLTFNAHGAPQRHNQARTVQDPDLLPLLGREYNRSNHEYQENYYFKPQFELHWDWAISEQQHLNMTSFMTTGSGGGRYLRNDRFDVVTGEVTFKPVDAGTDRKRFGRNARWVYDKTGVVLEGYNPTTNEFTYDGVTESVGSATPLVPSSFDHSWRNDSQNNHVQFGLNGSYTHKINQFLTLTFGGEFRHWDAEHYAESFDFRKADLVNGGVQRYDEVQRRYDYDGIVTNVSGFGRLLISPIEKMIITIDGQYASSKQKIEEKPIEIFDFSRGVFTGNSFYASKNSGQFTDDDYENTFSFFMPKFGVRYNVNNQVSIFGNYSIAKKEPKTGDWYDRSNGPRSNRDEITEETLTNLEFGVGYRHKLFAVEANWYRADFEDKIESVTRQDGNRDVINAGNALHTGFEVAATARIGKIDANVSISASSNEWEELNVQEIFGEDAADVEGKVVPFSPENMYSIGAGYNFTPNFRIGLDAQAWNRYYANYTNTVSLPNFFELNATVSYGFEINNARVDLRLDAYNLTNEEQFQRGDWTREFNAVNYDLIGLDSRNFQYRMYVLQSRLRTFFLTASLSI